MSDRTFPIRLGPRSRALLLLFGARPSNSYVALNGDLHASFGFFSIRTPVENIRRWRIEGPWSWFTAIGVRRGIRDGEITFGGNHRAGVKLEFKKPVKWSLVRPPALYVTVADVEAFAAALAERGIPGEDARRL
jgi:hypothetical protein